MQHSNLEALGWDSWFEEQARFVATQRAAVTRVAAVVGISAAPQ